MVATTSTAFILMIVTMAILGHTADDIAILDEDEKEEDGSEVADSKAKDESKANGPKASQVL